MKAIHRLFTTEIYQKKLFSNSTQINRSLTEGAFKIRDFDETGRIWSKSHFPGGYTSYSSLSRLFDFSTEFLNLKKKIDFHAKLFAQKLYWEIPPEELQMTSMWLNIVPPGTFHSLHLHPLAILSGTYYVRVPRKGGILKFEDPRLSKMMAAPPKNKNCPPEQRNFFSLKTQAGDLVLFESWLRHEVPQNLSPQTRISVSFNYERISPR